MALARKRYTNASGALVLYLSTHADKKHSNEDVMYSKIESMAFDKYVRGKWSFIEALEQSRAALPDQSFAEANGVDRSLIVEIDNALASIKTSRSQLKALLIEARNALPKAWENHSGCDDLLKLIDISLS